MADSDQIKVVIRIRPLIQREQEAGHEVRWLVQDKKLISQSDQPSLPPYKFDWVFDCNCTTHELYNGVIAPIVEAAMNGYHGTVFAYGQSGSGKTYTMSGDEMTQGVIAQAVDAIFEFIEQKPSHEFLMRASYMEIYNEKIYDLLSREEKHLKINETPDHQINVVGLEEELVNSCAHVNSVIRRGDAKRKFAETKQNDRSSRSHCIFRIIVESRLRNETNAAVMVSHLNFVDLAGSEKAGENSGDRFREGCSINMSLFCLSNVISKLSEGVGKQFIGYRDSKLTRILQNALGGNSKTVIVTTINPTAIEESHSTLRFATRAKTIKNKPHVNEVLSDAALLKKYRNQITELEKLVKEMGVADIQSANEDLKKRLEEKQTLIEQLTKQIIVSSVTDNIPVQKKKMRRETWAAPKIHRKSFFPSLPSLNHPSVTIREETDQEMDLACSEDLDLPFSITSANSTAMTRAFLRRSEEMALSDSLLTGGSEMSCSGMRSGDGRDLEDEVQRLEEVLKLKESEHAEAMEKLEERVKQLQYECAMERDMQEERDRNILSSQEEVTSLREKLATVQYECQLHMEENQLLQKNLWHLEEDNKRLQKEASHLLDKRFDFSLQEWDELQAAKASLESEIKQLVASLQQKDKDIDDLKKSLAGQDPYISRLEQQLEQYIGFGNGQLGTVGSNKRRSGIPVLVKSEGTNSPDRVKSEGKDSRATSETSASMEVPKTLMVDCATSTDDVPQVSTSHLSEGGSVFSPLPSETESSASALKPRISADRRSSLLDFRRIGLRAQKKSQNTVDGDMEQDYGNGSVSSKVANVSCVQEGERAQDDQREDEFVTPGRGEAAKVFSTCTESSTKIARQLKRRSNEIAETSLEDEICVRLREQSQELEQVSHDNTKLLEVLSQANVEIVRLKEAMKVMEQADAERIDELSEVPKLQALLNRRDMELQRLESENARLKEDLNHQMMNSSVSSLSTSFTEQRRKSSMLKEREAEIWKLKDQIIQQAKHIDDIQQKVDLDNIVCNLQTLSEKGNEQEYIENEESQSSCSSTPSSEPSSCKVREEEEEEEGGRETDKIMVTLAEMETVQRMLQDKDSLICHLKNQLQEKEDEMEQMFEGQMLVSSDMIQTHLQQAQDQREKIDMLEGRLKSREEEINKLRARAELRGSSSSSSCSSSQGEESNAFLEQLIMDKMALEESLQEKIAELTQATEHSEELQAHLDERRAVVNQLRQQQEDTTEALLSTQEELIALKRFVESEQAKNTQNEENPGLEEGSLEIKETKNSASQSAECTEEPCMKEEAAVIKEESFEVSFKAPSDGNNVEHSHEGASNDGEDEDFEVSFKTAGPMITDDAKNDSIHHTAKYPSEMCSLDPQVSSFEVSFKMKGTESNSSDITHFNQRLEYLEQREAELLEVMKEKEKQIQSLMILHEQASNKFKPVADSKKDSKSSVCEDVATESTSNGAHLVTNSSELPLEMECQALLEQKNLEKKIPDAETVIEEKTVLEARIQVLVKLVAEKSAVISQLQKRCEEIGSQSETMQTEMDQAHLKTTEGEIWAEEKEKLLAKLAHMSHVEECLENNIKMLELSQEEKAGLNHRLQELEVRLEQLRSTEEDLEAEKEALGKQLKEESSKLEFAHSEVQQLRSENVHIISQKAELESEVEELKARSNALQAEIEETQNTKATLEQQRNAENEREQEALDKRVKETLAKLESAQSELQQLRSENDHNVSQKTQLESEVNDLKTKVTILQAEVEQADRMAIQQKDGLEQKVLKLTGRMEELTSMRNQMASEHEELTSELNWQTKENEKMQARVEELEAELEEAKQEAEDLLQELEKVQKLQDDSEQCQRVVEDTLENFKAQNAKLEADKHSLATERDEFELRAEAALKEQERLRLDLKVTRDRLQNKISALEMELQTSEQRKQVLEAALADKESAQRMGELLHDKLSVDLQESQAQVSIMKTALSELQFELHNQETKFNTLKKITTSLEVEKDQLMRDKTDMETERAQMRFQLSSLEEEVKALQKELASNKILVQDKSALEKEKAELKAKVSSLEDELRALHKDLSTKRAIEQTKQALETRVLKQQKEQEQLQANIDQLKQEVEAGAQTAAQLQQEKVAAQASCRDLSDKVSLLETHYTQAKHDCKQMSHTLQQLQQAMETSEQRVTSARSECRQLQDELGSKLELIEQLQNELETVKASYSSNSGEKMVPLIEVKNQKFLLKKRIAHLTRDLDAMKAVSADKDQWLQELQEKVYKYENEEQEDKDENIKRLEEEKRQLENDLKAKDLELAGNQMKQQDAIAKLRKELSNAEEMVTYKEQTISKLKGEIRRIRSDEVSFFSSTATKSKATEVAKPAEEERVISSHSGIIDRYTVTLLEADKYKLKKELQKTQERLQCRESELHWVKVALAKAKAAGGSTPTSPMSADYLAAPNSTISEGRTDQKSVPALQRESTAGMVAGPGATALSSGGVRIEQHSLLLERMGTSVDAVLPSSGSDVRVGRDVVLKGAGDSVSKTDGSASRSENAGSGSATVRTTGDCAVARTVRQQDDCASMLQFGPLSAIGSPVDLKKDRIMLPSAVDKENTPCGTDVLAAYKAVTDTGTQDVASAQGPINIQPEFWKKPKRPPTSTYRDPSARLLGRTAAASAEQCKTQ